MNALALWLPGSLLLLIAVVLLALGRLDLPLGMAVAGAGLALETLGVLLWIRQRSRSAKG